MSSFRPIWPWGNAHLQSILPSLLPRRPLLARTRALREGAREVLLDCGEETRLQAFLTDAAQPADQLAILLHGWEGSAESHYILSLGQRLLDAGVDVARLNLRDHGNTHHLNRDLFHSCRLTEVVGAVAALQRQARARQVWLIGFSLGGNFLLRVAASGDARLGSIAGVIAISPVLEPAATLTALEKGLPVYQRYFVRKWRRSLRRKQAAWPKDHDFSAMINWSDLRRMTDVLVSRHTQFPDIGTYLSGYAITGDRLRNLVAPALIIAAEDDPIIPAADLERLASSAHLDIERSPRGGHMGFFAAPFARSWVEDVILRRMRA